MKRWLTMLYLGVLAVAVIVAYATSDALARERSGNPVVVIDPAHGGQEKGVNVKDDIYEKDITLALSKLIQKFMEGKKNIRMELTRTADQGVSFSERVRKTESARADLFISIHVNAGFDRRASGFEVYFPGFEVTSGEKNESSEIVKDMVRTQYLNEGVKYARILLKHMEKVFPRKDRGLRDAPIRILRGLKIPAVVLETGFATESASRRDLLRAAKQKDIAEAVGKSIQEYFRHE